MFGKGSVTLGVRGRAVEAEGLADVVAIAQGGGREAGVAGMAGVWWARGAQEEVIVEKPAEPVPRGPGEGGCPCSGSGFN